MAHLMRARMIKPEYINQYVFNPKNRGIFECDLRDIKQYLQDVRLGITTAKDMQQGVISIKSKVFSRIAEFFKKDKSDW